MDVIGADVQVGDKSPVVVVVEDVAEGKHAAHVPVEAVECGRGGVDESLRHTVVQAKAKEGSGPCWGRRVGVCEEAVEGEVSWAAYQVAEGKFSDSLLQILPGGRVRLREEAILPPDLLPMAADVGVRQVHQALGAPDGPG